MRLENRVALITGASRGLGKAMALAFASEGASVAVNYVKNREQAELICEEIVESGGMALPVQADVSNPAEVKAMVKIVEDVYGDIDILVNNAGLFAPISLIDDPPSKIDRLYEVNIKGIIYTVQAVIGKMKERKYGRILNISSIAGLGTAVANTSGYAATKAAVISLTKRMALELGEFGVTVNGIAPGFVKTDMTLHGGVTEASPEDLKAIAERAMLNRVGEPEDIAYPALFLVSDEASFITGQTLTVDGGRKDFLSHSA
jgi:3-oxoacyl-[acyl-carrier protein] reductase